MAVDTQVFKAILAMDSYNRDADLDLQVSQIGLANIRTDIKPPDGFDAASFAASVYTYKGETIISYRGTDAKTDVLTAGRPEHRRASSAR